MDQPKLTHEARCLIIVAGGVLESRLKNLAQSIAEARGAVQIAGEDVDEAVRAFLGEQIPQLPHLIESAIDEYKRRSAKAA